MQLRDISFATPRENIAYDEVLFHMAEKQGGGEFLRFWESPKVFIVLGKISREDEDVDSARARQDEVPVLRRSSGGGTVVQGPGCLNFTLVLSKHRSPHIGDLRRSYAWISAKIIEALELDGVKAFFKPLSDLAAGPGEKKFSGNAQRRGKNYILHHGTLLYDFDLSLISRYLKMPRQMPEYRQMRSHLDFVANIALDPGAFKKNLAKAFDALSNQKPSPKELSLLKNFCNCLAF